MSTTGPLTRATRPTTAVAGWSAGAVRVIFVSFLMVYLLERASAPPTISAICCVISAWRALLRRRV